ncbi:hypothetical protein LEMLEM_LOCUS5196, partial [Lemmus lemmus]
MDPARNRWKLVEDQGSFRQDGILLVSSHFCCFAQIPSAWKLLSTGPGCLPELLSRHWLSLLEVP